MRKDTRFLRWIWTSTHKKHCLQQRARPKKPPTHTHTHHPSLARPRSGQAGSWETIPVALLTFFISERLKNIPDIMLSALLLFLFAVFTHFQVKPFVFFFSTVATDENAIVLLSEGFSVLPWHMVFIKTSVKCSQRFYWLLYRRLKQSNKSFISLSKTKLNCLYL